MIQLHEVEKKRRQNPAVMTGRSEMSHYADNKGPIRIILMLHVVVLKKVRYFQRTFFFFFCCNRYISIYISF